MPFISGLEISGRLRFSIEFQNAGHNLAVPLSKTDSQKSKSGGNRPARKPASAAPAFLPRSWLEGGLAILDSAGRMADANEPLCNWLETPRERLVGKCFWEIVEKLSTDRKPSLRCVQENSTPFARMDLKIRSADSQSSQWLALEIARGAENAFVRLSSILPPLAELEEGIWDEHLRSDSARREMFMRLLRAEAQLDSLMRRWPCVIFSQRPDFSLQFVSPNIEEMTGIAAADWRNSSQAFWRVVHESDAAHLQQQFKHAAQSGSAITNTYRIRHLPTGRVIYILEHRQPTISQNGLLLGYEVVWLDVTRQTIAEKRLSTAAWKETLAVLTLGMAHDFRNMMAGIHSLSESFLSEVDAKHPFHEGLALIKKNSQHASQLVHGIINLHLGETGERNYYNLNDLASELADLVGKIFPRRIQVKTELSAKTLPIYADLVEFRQVIINLLLNAADAMSQGGTLTLRTSHHAKLPALENFKGVKPRMPCVCLSIEDTGCGIKARHLSSIFDPFFTTKSKGSGLGLYNARLAVEKSKGAISVKSTEGAGTAFQIWLPEANFSEASVDAESPQSNETRRSLLLFGQPGELLDRTAEFLRSHNYHVVATTAIESVPELLESADYQFAGMMILAEPDDGAFNASLDEACGRGKKIKTILKLACNQDDLDSELLNRADLLLNPDISQTEMLGRLRQLLD
ncbi:MAG TPA: ATP-binding protein [Verrucomicrobiae bacterium]|nr:ATP-binding protein [Verrucomicrobiae bacterium]